MNKGEKKMMNEGLKSLAIGLAIILLTYIMYKIISNIGFDIYYIGFYVALGLIAYFVLGLFKKKNKDENEIN